MLREGMQELEIESPVKARYSGAALAREPELCCPVLYDPALLVGLPEEVLVRDYGCGDPSRHVRPGETTLDLGSGTGKICFITSQVVGPSGRVIGVDINDDMLDLAHRNAPSFARHFGYANVTFGKGRHVLRRGVGTAVCEKTLRILSSEPYRSHMHLVEPLVPVDAADARPFPCAKGAIVRSPRETKDDGYNGTIEAAPIVCLPGGDCC